MLFGFDKEFQTIFLFIFTLLIFFVVPSTYLNIKGGKLEKIYSKSLLKDGRFWVVCIVYFVIFGFRYNYLQDWSQYVRYYEYIQSGGENNGWREPGFYIFLKMLTILGFNYYAMFVIECFMWIFSICYLFKDNRKYLVWVLPFVFVTSTNLALVISRQFFAMSFLLLAYRDYWDGKNLRALIFACIAPMLHFSAVIWVPVFYFLKKIEFVKPVWMVSAFLVITVSSSVFFDILASSAESITVLLNLFFDSAVYDVSTLDSLQSETMGANLRQMLTLSITRGIYIYSYYYFRKRGLLSNPIMNNIALIGSLAIIVDLLLGYNMIFSRFATYIRIFYDIGWGIFSYMAFVRIKAANTTSKILIFLAMFYMFGSFFLGLGGRKAEVSDVNPFLIYEIK